LILIVKILEMKLAYKSLLISLPVVISSFAVYNTIYAESKTSQAAEPAQTRVDHSEKTTLRLSDDIGKMADRIGVMADRILAMADKILETQRIQWKNVELTQKNILKSMELINKTLEQNNELLKQMIQLNSKMIDCMCKNK